MYAPVELFAPCVKVPLVCVNANVVLIFFATTDPVVTENGLNPEIVLLFPSNVPFVKVNAELFPVRASARNTVPPTPLIFIGPAKVTPLVVMIWVPDVAPNVTVPVDGLNVIPDANVNDP